MYVTEGKYNPYEAQGPETLSEKLKHNLLRDIENIEIFEHPHKGEDEAGNRADTFFIKYPVEDDIHLGSIVKIPNEHEYSVANLHAEAKMIEFLQGKVDCVPQFLGFNNTAEILHMSFIHTENPYAADYAALISERPLECVAALLDSVQQIHRLNVVHNDIFLYSNTLMIERPGNQLKAVLLDFAGAERFASTIPNEDFERARRDELKSIISLLPIAVMEDDTFKQPLDAEKVISDMIGLGMEAPLARKLYKFQNIFSRDSLTFDEVDEIIQSLRNSSLYQAPKESSSQPIRVFGNEVSHAYDKIAAVNEYLMNF